MMNYKIPTSLLLILVVFISQSSAVELAVKLEGREEHCFYDSIGERILVRLTIVCDKGEFLEFKVSNQEGTFSETYSELKTLNFQNFTQFGGEYLFCFHNTDLKQDITVYFNYKTGVEAKDYADLIKKEDGVKFKLSAKRLEDTLQDISLEKKFLVKHQQYNSALQNDLTFKIQGFSIITLFLLVALAIFQSYYLRQFFKEKKML
ncbi:hypothetical protein ABPG72_015867 [Tetrahymena utriculariae]